MCMEFKTWEVSTIHQMEFLYGIPHLMIKKSYWVNYQFEIIDLFIYVGPFDNPFEYLAPLPKLKSTILSFWKFCVFLFVISAEILQIGRKTPNNQSFFCCNIGRPKGLWISKNRNQFCSFVCLLRFYVPLENNCYEKSIHMI